MRDPYDRVWTLPNALSMLRILLIGVFIALLANKQDGWAIATLAVTGFSDFFDGFLARRWNQVTKLGAILDPAADRLLTLAIVLGLGARGIVPWWLVAVLLARDAFAAVMLAWGKSRGATAPAVTFSGKAATFGLYVFLPLMFLAHGHWPPVVAVAFVGALVAAVVYWYSAIGYARDIRSRVAATR